jgi:hypothetical protein
MKERPIIFSGTMVRAILEGRKTQTRRIVKPQPEGHHWERLPGYKAFWTSLACSDGIWWKLNHRIPQNTDEERHFRCPYGQPGDRLWVRESFYACERDHWPDLPSVPANNGRIYFHANFDRSAPGPLRPSIHMPRWASRILLEVTDVRVERLQEISDEDAAAEGAGLRNCGVMDTLDGPEQLKSYRTGFVYLWRDIHGAESWAENPWVWAISFKVLEVKGRAA